VSSDQIEHTSRLTVGQECCNLPIRINAGGRLNAVTFSANGEHVLSGDDKVWQVEDRNKMATMKTKTVWCLAVSTDRRWITAGTQDGHLDWWDVNTYKQVFGHKVDVLGINGVDFSPDLSLHRITAQPLFGTLLCTQKYTHFAIHHKHCKIVRFPDMAEFPLQHVRRVRHDWLLMSQAIVRTEALHTPIVF